MLYFSPQKVVKSCWSGLLLQAVETSYASRFKQKEIHWENPEWLVGSLGKLENQAQLIG